MTQKWLQGAVEHPGALRAKMRRVGLSNGDAPLTFGALQTMKQRAQSSGDTTTVRQVNLAHTLKRMARGGLVQ